jgi:hypothetical protein
MVSELGNWPHGELLLSPNKFGFSDIMCRRVDFPAGQMDEKRVFIRWTYGLRAVLSGLFDDSFFFTGNGIATAKAPLCDASSIHMDET